MILVDFSQIIIGATFVNLKGHYDADIDENMLRHVALNQLRSINKKFKKEYGEMILCCEGGASWRKEIFPYYKAARKEGRDKSEMDWDMIFTSINHIQEELKEYSPYRVMRIPRAEADDIIGTLTHLKGQDMNIGEPILIVSTDKDFIQLQKYANVKQYSPRDKDFIVNSDPEEYLFRHIAKGDSGDGVPNVLSDDDVFMIAEKRQGRVTEKRLALWKSNEWISDPEADPDIKARFKRNEHLVDLRHTPDDIKNAIIEEYKIPNNKDRSKMLPYFMDKGLKHLTEYLGDF